MQRYFLCLVSRRGLSLLLLSALLVAGCGGGEPDRELWILGLDGADWDILDPMIERGELPHLARLREEGAYGRLRSDEPMLSPMIWTSIATGKTADEHGITWFMTDSPDGEKIPVSSRNRWVRAIWNIATERDLSSSVVGWWATWPVEPIDGFLVSDYVGWHSFGMTGRQFDAPGKIWPTDLQAELLGLLPTPDDVSDDLLQTMVHLPADALGFDKSRGPFGGPLPHLRQAVATARGYTDIALELLERRRTNFFAVYYEGTDAAMHLFSNYAPPQQPWVSDEDYAAFQDAVTGYWRYQDRLVGELLAQRKENTVVMVVSDHGFRTGDERLREEQFEIERAHASHMIDGVIVLNGPGVRAGTKLRGADIYDVAPTTLHLMGLPVAEDMIGNVLESALTEDFLAAHPIETIATYDTGEWDRGDDLVVDPGAGERMEEMLRSLGYISGGEGDSGDTTHEANDATEPGTSHEGMTVEEAVNLANVLTGQGRLEEAARSLEEQLAVHPGHFRARLNLAKIYSRLGESERALPLFSGLHEEEPEDLEVIEDYALGLVRADRLEQSLEIYEKGLELDPEWVTGMAGQGLVKYQLGRSEEGLRELERAVEIDPREALGHYYLALAHLDRGDLEAAEKALERTLALDPTHEQAALHMSQILQSRGEVDRAKSSLQDFLEKSGESARVSAEIAAIDLRADRPEEALSVLREAVSAHPDDPDLLGKLGLAQAMTNDLEQARSTFERQLELDPDSPDAHAQLGNLYLQSGDAQRAEQHLEQAAELAPRNTDARLGLANLYRRSGRLEQALETYRTGLVHDPEWAAGWAGQGLVKHQLGRSDEGLREIERAVEIDPSLPMGHYHLAVVHRDRGDGDASWKALERTLELDPSHEEAAVQLAQMLQSQGQVAQAKSFLQGFLEKTGESPQVRAEIAAIDLQAGRAEEALPVLREAVAERPNDPHLLGNLGLAQAMTGDLEQARSTFERLIEVDPGSPDAHAQLGNFYLQSGDAQKAEQHLERAAELAPDDIRVQLGLATFYHRSGDLDAATEIYEKVLEREPDHALALYQLALATGAQGNEEKAMELLQRARELDPSLPMPGQRPRGRQ